MSYCRLGDGSDVYLYAHIYGGWHCCGCLLKGDALLKTREEALAHLQSHVEAGHMVPTSAMKRLRKEIAESTSAPALGARE